MTSLSLSLTVTPIAIRWPIAYGKRRKFSFAHFTLDGERTLCSVDIPRSDEGCQTGIYIPVHVETCSKCARMAALVVQRAGKSLKVLEPYRDVPKRPALAWRRTGRR